MRGGNSHMLFTRQRAKEYEELRKQVGDTAIIDEAINNNSPKGKLFSSLRQEGVDDSAIISEYIKQKSTWNLPETQWQGMSPQVQKSYQRDYNINIVPVGKPQAETTQPEKEKPSILQWGVKAVTEPIQKIREPGQKATGFLLSKERQALGIVPKVTVLENKVYTGDKAYIDELVRQQKMPTTDMFISKYGEDKANQIMADIVKMNPDAFSEKATRRARGETGTQIAKLKGEKKYANWIDYLASPPEKDVGIKAVVDEKIRNFIEGILSPSQILDPVEFGLNIAGAKLMSGISARLWESAFNKELLKQVKAGTIKPESAKQAIQEAKYFYDTMPIEKIQAYLKGGIPQMKIPGALRKGEVITPRNPNMVQEIKSQFPKPDQNLEEAIPRTEEQYAGINERANILGAEEKYAEINKRAEGLAAEEKIRNKILLDKLLRENRQKAIEEANKPKHIPPGVRMQIEKIRANASAKLMEMYDEGQIAEAQRGADSVIMQVGSDWRKLSNVLNKQSSATNALTELGVLHNLTNINATDQMIVDALKAKVSVRTQINKAMGRGSIKFSETGDPILDIQKDFEVPINEVPPQETPIEQPIQQTIENAPEKPIEQMPEVRATEMQEQAIPSAEVPKEPYEMSKQEFINNPPPEADVYLSDFDTGKELGALKGKIGSITDWSGQTTEGYRVANTIQSFEDVHKRLVKQAIDEDKITSHPDYPDLAKTVQKEVTPEPTTAVEPKAKTQINETTIKQALKHLDIAPQKKRTPTEIDKIFGNGVAEELHKQGLASGGAGYNSPYVTSVQARERYFGEIPSNIKTSYIRNNEFFTAYVDIKGKTWKPEGTVREFAGKDYAVAEIKRPRAEWKDTIEGQSKVYASLEGAKADNPINAWAKAEALIPEAPTVSPEAIPEAQVAETVLEEPRNATLEEGFPAVKMNPDDIAGIVKNIKKDISDKILSVKGILKQPKQVGEMGAQLKDAYATEQEVKRLEAELNRWNKWYEESPDSEIRQRIDKELRDKNLADTSQFIMDLGAKGEDINDPVAMAKTKLDDFVDQRADEVGKNIEEKAPSGGLALRIIRTKGGRTKTLPKEPPIANKELAETLTTGEKSNYGRTKELFNRQIHNAWNILTAKFEPELMKDAKEFPEAIPQFVDNFRSQFIPIVTRSTEFADKALYAMWGDITGVPRKYLMRMIGIRALKSRKTMGLPVSRDISLDVLEKEIADMTALLNKSDEGKLVLERVETFKELMHNIGENLVARKKLKIEALDAQDFYFPFTPEDYFRNYPSMSRKARQAFRPYTLEAQGTTRDVVMTEDASRAYLAQVHMDDAMDDFTIRNLVQFDVYAKVLRSKSDDELLAIFHDEDFNIKPNNIYKIDGKPYRAYQEIPGNIKYVGDIVNKNKLIEEDIPDIIANGENQSDDEILSRLESLRRGLIVGSKHKSYLIPEPIAKKLLQLKPPSEEILPGLVEAARLTRMWKRVTLTYAGIPYQTLNIAGDLYNVLITSEGAFKPDIIKSSTKILNYVKHPARYGDHYLTQFEKDILRIAQEKDVLGSGFMSEWRSASRPLNVPGYEKVKTKWERFNYSRESIPRLIELTYQWDRHVKGKGFVGEAFKKDIAHLDAESAAGYISRNATIDYRAVPDWYRRHMNGLLFPFLTWSQKNIINMAKNFRTPLGIAKMGLKIGIPFAAAYIYNTVGDRKYIYDRLGYFKQRSSTMIIKGEDLSGDGKPDQAWILAPQLPWDSATEITGWSQLAPLINQVQRGKITPEEAARTFIYGLGTEPARHLARMTTPIAQFLIGVALNKDPVDKQPIVPENLKDIEFLQKAPYFRNYFLEKLVSPFGQYIRQADKGEATDAFGILSKGPFDLPRALGLYKVNLVANEARELLKLSSKKEAQYAYWLYCYKQKYVEGDEAGMDEIDRKATKKGYPIPYKKKQNLGKNKTVQKKVILHKMKMSDESNYINAVDDMGTGSPIGKLRDDIRNPWSSSEQKKDYQKTLDSLLMKQALKEAKKYGLSPEVETPEESIDTESTDAEQRPKEIIPEFKE